MTLSYSYLSQKNYLNLQLTLNNVEVHLNLNIELQIKYTRLITRKEIILKY